MRQQILHAIIAATTAIFCWEAGGQIRSYVNQRAEKRETRQEAIDSLRRVVDKNNIAQIELRADLKWIRTQIETPKKVLRKQSLDPVKDLDKLVSIVSELEDLNSEANRQVGVLQVNEQ